MQVDKGFVAQVADVVNERSAPMNEEQRKEAEKKIVGEFSHVKHVRGTLSMGRYIDFRSCLARFVSMFSMNIPVCVCVYDEEDFCEVMFCLSVVFVFFSVDMKIQTVHNLHFRCFLVMLLILMVRSAS